MGTKARLRRSLFGYRPRDVDEAIAKRDAQLEARRVEVEAGAGRIRELERGSTWLAERVVERERVPMACGTGGGARAGAARAAGELASARVGRGDQRTLTTLADDLKGVRRQARGQATRIRLRALREAAELTEQIAELGDQQGEVREQ